MPSYITFYPGGFDPVAAANNIAETFDTDNNVHTVYDPAGNIAVRERIRAFEQTLPSSVQPGDIRSRVTAALTTNRAFLAISSPTAAQAIAQVTALTRQVNGILRFLAGVAVDSGDT